MKSHFFLKAQSVLKRNLGIKAGTINSLNY
jgi:hypothetical protein